MDFDNLSNMHGMVRVYFDPDIDVYSDFTTKHQTSSDEKGVFYDVWGYDNELEEDFWYLNPIDRIFKLNSLPEADRRNLELNIKKIARKAICDKFYYTIARRLFYATNSLIDNNNQFTTVQQAYSYALSGETFDSPTIPAADFITLAELYSCVWRAHNHDENGINELISLREMIILLEIMHKNHVFKDNIASVLNMLAYVREESLIDRLGFDSFFDDDTIFGARKNTFIGRINMDDLYNNIQFSNILEKAENANGVVKTLEFQRLIGSEPSLLLQFGTGFCNDFAICNFCKATSIYGKNLIFDIFIKDLEPNSLGATFMARIETIIKNNSVKKPDISVNNEICSYISSLSTHDITKYRNVGIGIDYYNAIVLYIFDKIKYFYEQKFSQKQVDFIASIIYYYLYPIYNIEGIIHDKSHDNDGENSLRFRLSKLSKIVENMVKDGDFCSYPSEFIEQKAETLYFG